MNALKLADDLNNANGFQYIAQLGLASQAATMLRQQQERVKQLEETQEYLYKTHDADKAEIEALKDALRMKVILNEHAQQSMKEYKELLK